jgi:DmsE family decaheme c-type cytochrome
MNAMPIEKIGAFVPRCCIALVIATAAVWSVESNAQAPGPNPQVTEALCTACHRDKFTASTANPHRVLDTPEWRERTGNAPHCLNCHGDVSEHINAGGGQGNVFAFREESAARQNEVCLGCHSASHSEFDRSAHAQAGLSCTNCHSQHAAQPAAGALLRERSSFAGLLDQLGSSSQLCVDCHDDVLTAFDFNERHRLREGALECASCHDPHAPVTRSLLGGFKQQQCLECHSEKGGPFVFEHAASRVEGCTACHSPHGSPNRHMLAHQQVGELCLGCHASVPQFHFGFSPVGPPRFGLDTQCTNCHTTIHGSNLDPKYLK